MMYAFNSNASTVPLPRITSYMHGEIYNLPVVLFNFPVKQEKRCMNPPLRAGDRVRVEG